MAHNIFRGEERGKFSRFQGSQAVPARSSVRLREGKGLGSETGKVLGCGLYSEQRREIEGGLYCV
jgi:hypothetical protein